jgi:hypothetical protein
MKTSRVEEASDPYLAPSIRGAALYSSKEWVPEEDLRNWTEYKNPTHFRNRILSCQHRARLIEYDLPKGRAKLTPKGVKDVEERILPQYGPS